MDLPLGPLVSDEIKPIVPLRRTPLHGRYTSVVPLRPDHAGGLFKHLGGPRNAWRWTYMLIDGFPQPQDCERVIRSWSKSASPLYCAVLAAPSLEAEAEPLGMMAYFNEALEHRRVEIGGVILGERLKQSREATEAFYLLIRQAFELGYVRVEWKANDLNGASKRAAERLGFRFEGVFRKHMIVKGRHRDTAYFSITIDDWPQIGRGFELWLDEGNFDEHGRQKKGLKQCHEDVKA